MVNCISQLGRCFFIREAAPVSARAVGYLIGIWLQIIGEGRVFSGPEASNEFAWVTNAQMERVRTAVLGLFLMDHSSQPAKPAMPGSSTEKEIVDRAKNFL